MLILLTPLNQYYVIASLAHANEVNGPEIEKEEKEIGRRSGKITVRRNPRDGDPENQTMRMVQATTSQRPISPENMPPVPQGIHRYLHESTLNSWVSQTLFRTQSYPYFEYTERPASALKLSKLMATLSAVTRGLGQNHSATVGRY